jgi:hypothetical protein
MASATTTPPFFVADWTSGTFATDTEVAASTLYYTLSRWNPCGEVILKSEIRASLPIVTPGPMVAPSSSARLARLVAY